MALVWLNGSFIEDADANISLRDTGLLHAAGAFYDHAQLSRQGVSHRTASEATSRIVRCSVCAAGFQG